SPPTWATRTGADPGQRDPLEPAGLPARSVANRRFERVQDPVGYAVDREEALRLASRLPVERRPFALADAVDEPAHRALEPVEVSGREDGAALRTHSLSRADLAARHDRYPARQCFTDGEGEGLVVTRLDHEIRIPVGVGEAGAVE